MTYHKHQTTKVIKGPYAGAMGVIVRKISCQIEEAWLVDVTTGAGLCKAGDKVMVFSSELQPVRFKRVST